MGLPETQSRKIYRVYLFLSNYIIFFIITYFVFLLKLILTYLLAETSAADNGLKKSKLKVKVNGNMVSVLLTTFQFIYQQLQIMLTLCKNKMMIEAVDAAFSTYMF